MKYLIVLLIYIVSTSAASAPYPITLESVIRDSDKVAVFEVIGVEYIKKDMIFNSTDRSGKNMSYNTKMLLTKYTMEVTQSIKNIELEDIYEIYSDGGIDIVEGEGVKSSVGFNLGEGESVLVMIKYDVTNDIYMPTYHNSTVFKISSKGEETILTPYSDIIYYKEDANIEALISGNKSFDKNMLLKEITLDNVVGLANE
ncbi:MAG: hypothetical protein PF630_05175 [Gammaproteobacteria bacterium]|nr:hypothetical protein [Gammaproteobacteria bacterium]